MAMQLNDKGLRSDINVTPLVDVMLVLLIIFMVITPMLQKGRAVQLPQVSKPERQPDNGTDVVISLEYGGKPGRHRIFVAQNATPVDEAGLKSRLEDELRRNPSHEIYLKGDARLSYGAVRKVMEICHSAGYPQVKLATEEIKQKI